MRNLGIALIAAAALCLATPALADRGEGGCEGNPHNCNGGPGGGGGPGGQGAPGGGVFTNTNDNTNRNDNSARSSSSSNGFGVGVGIGQGGNARAAGGDANSRSGVSGSGNSRNHNDSSARVGNVGAFSGVDFGRADIGNSTNDLSNRNRNRVDTNTNTSTSTSTQQGQQQGQIQGQLQGQQVVDESSVNLDASDHSNNDNSTYVEAADIPVASAAPVFASACSAGVSGQSMGFGGSLATTNPMCDMALAAEMARAVGNDELAYELTIEAATFARARTNIVRRFGQWIPFVGSLW